MRQVGAALIKFGRRPATPITLGVMIVLVGMIYIMLAASLDLVPDATQREAIAGLFVFPDAYGALAGLLLTFAVLAAAAYAGALAGGEWSWGPFRVAVARGESRTRYVLANFAALALLMLVGFAILFLVGVLFSVLSAGLAGVAIGDPLAGEALAGVPAIVLGGGWVVIMAAAIAFAVGFAMRNAVSGLVAVVALYFAEQMAAIVVPLELLRLAPISAGTQLLRGAAEMSGIAAMWLPLGVTAAYVGLALLALVVVARRVEAA